MAASGSEDRSNDSPDGAGATGSGFRTGVDGAEPETDPPFINQSDGLPNLPPHLLRLAALRRSPDRSPDPDADGDLEADEDLPRSLIVTSIDAEVFGDESLKADLEDMFRDINPEVTFQWLRSFRRLRVNYATAAAAATARVRLHQTPFHRARLNCYFAQAVSPCAASSLQPPRPLKQFLISPPSSPPLGWEPRPEHEPLVNHELLAALAALAPGDCHQVVPPHGEHPAIVVHAASVPTGSAPAPADCQ